VIRLATTFKLFLAALVAGAALIGTTADRAQALTPEQRDPVTLVSQLTRSINTFWAKSFASWGYRYRAPRLIQWYNTGRAAPVHPDCEDDELADGFITLNVAYSNETWGDGNSFYCPADEKLYLDYRFFQFLINSDDYAAGVILAHEWGHHIQTVLGGNRPRGAGFELEADCFAGLSSRYGVQTRLLNTGDINWGAHMLSLVGDTTTGDDAHGTPAQRKGWFLYGYKTGNARACSGAYR